MLALLPRGVEESPARGFASSVEPPLAGGVWGGTRHLGDPSGPRVCDTCPVSLGSPGERRAGNTPARPSNEVIGPLAQWSRALIP